MFAELMEIISNHWQLMLIININMYDLVKHTFIQHCFEKGMKWTKTHIELEHM
jgi:hypothetical protein